MADTPVIKLEEQVAIPTGNVTAAPLTQEINPELLKTDLQLDPETKLTLEQARKINSPEINQSLEAHRATLQFVPQKDATITTAMEKATTIHQLLNQQSDIDQKNIPLAKAPIKKGKFSFASLFIRDGSGMEPTIFDIILEGLANILKKLEGRITGAKEDPKLKKRLTAAKIKKARSQIKKKRRKKTGFYNLDKEPEEVHSEQISTLSRQVALETQVTKEIMENSKLESNIETSSLLLVSRNSDEDSKAKL